MAACQESTTCAGGRVTSSRSVVHTVPVPPFQPQPDGAPGRVEAGAHARYRDRDIIGPDSSGSVPVAAFEDVERMMPACPR